MKVSCLKSCDLLHVPMSLSYRNEYFYTTHIGAVLTILCLIIIVIITSFEIKTLTDKSSFTIITNQYIDLNEKIDFSRRPLLFQLINNAGEIMEIDHKLYEFKAYDMEWIVEKDENGKSKYSVINNKLEIDQCDKVLTSNFSEYLTDYNLSNYYCIKSGQNITSYGYLGDMNNGYKGFRVYLNKCNGNKDCYEDKYILQKLKNIKFRVTYLGLNANIFTLENQNLKLRMFSKACSVSTSILKKFYFTFSIGKFNLYDNIFLKQKREFNYIIGNNPIMDIDTDPSSTIDKNGHTLAYFSFNFDGTIIEVTKEVKRILDTISIIGNAFNIILTLFKIINNYYSNKILFADIFRSIFFSKENNNINIHKFSQKSIFKINNDFNSNNINNILNNSKKDILDLSDDNYCKNKILNNNNFKKAGNKMIINSDKNNNLNRRISKITQNFTINKEKIVNNKLIYFYIFPLWLLKKNKSFNNIVLIKDKICTYFSIEKINELILFKESLDYRTKKIKTNNTEYIKINKKFQDSNDSNNDNKNKNRNN